MPGYDLVRGTLGVLTFGAALDVFNHSLEIAP